MSRIYSAVLGLLVCTSLLFFTGCGITKGVLLQVTGTTSLLAIDVKTADTLLQTGEVEQVVLEGNYGPEELAILESAFADYSAVRTELKELIRDPEKLATADTRIKAMHAKLVTAFYATEGVIVSHWDQYSESEQIVLDAWAKRVRSAEDRYQSLVSTITVEIEKDAKRQLAIEITKIVIQIASTRLGV